MVDKQMRTLMIITLAMMFSGCVYFGALFAFPGEAQGVEPALGMALILASVGSVVGMLFMRRSMLGGLALLPPRRMDTGMRLSPEAFQQALKAALGRYTTATIVSCAFAESIMLYGFVIGYLSQAPLRMVPFLLAGELLMVMVFPRRAVLDGLVQQ